MTVHQTCESENSRRTRYGKSSVRQTAFVALAFSCGCFSIGFPLGKLVLQETNAGSMIMLRFAIAGFASLPLALRRRESRALFLSPWIIGGATLYGLGSIFQLEGLARVSVTMAALIVGLMPALLAFSSRLLGDHINKLTWSGIALAGVGALIIAGKPSGAGSPLGVLLSVLGLLSFLGWLLTMRKLPPSPFPMAIPSVTIVIAAAVIWLLAFTLHGPPALTLSSEAWACLLGQGLLSTILGTAAWQFGARYVDAASAGVFINIEPVVGALLGIGLFGDHLTAALALGGALVVLGSFAAVVSQSDRRPPSSTQSAISREKPT